MNPHVLVLQAPLKLTKNKKPLSDGLVHIAIGILLPLGALIKEVLHTENMT